jgi:hypothetical protein
MVDDKRLNETTYASAKIFLKATLEHMIKAGRSAQDLGVFALEKFGEDFLPYLQRFLRDVGEMHIDIKGLQQSTKTAILGHHVTPEERQDMIRVAAYLRAEQRGFSGDFAQNDWLAAEHEVDEQLAREAGWVVKGSQLLASVSGAVERELGSITEVLEHWYEEKFGVSREPTIKTPQVKETLSAEKPSAKTVKKQTGKKTGSAEKKETRKTEPKKGVRKKTTKD